MEPISLRTPLALLLISLSLIASVWWWLATPITLPRAPIDPNAKLQCVSYAPFRDTQTPLVPTTHISAEQIEQVMEYLVTHLPLFGVASTERGPQGDTDVQHEHGYYSRYEDENPDNPWADLRQQAEEFC